MARTHGRPRGSTDGRRGERPGSAFVVGVVEQRGRFRTAMPFFARGRNLSLDRDKLGRPGDLVLVRPLGARGGHGQVVRVIGRPDVARDVIEALMLDRGLRRRFDPAVEREARAHAEEPPAGGGAARRDLTALPTFTIDPPTAKDHDDAISAERRDDGTIRVWVHIADVAAHVPPRSLVDREAQRRGTSVYVPGAVEPMLPHALSSNACSLLAGAERPAVTVELDLRAATVTRAAFHRSLIRSDARLSYPDVDRIFSGTDRAREPWAAALDAARAAAAALESARQARGALVVDSPEPEFSFDPEGHVRAVEPRTQTESHRLVEHLMIAANEAVAGLLEDRGIPALYRVHEDPDPPRIERLVEQLASLGVPTPPLPEAMTARQAADAVGEISRLVHQHAERTGRGGRALSSLVLRALKQAHYTPRNAGHAGLQSPRYAHFTSPIRRYPDLVVHRALLSAVGGGESAPAASGLDELGAWCSERERDAMKLERAADDVARCFLLEHELFVRGYEREWDGEVIGMVGGGCFVAFGDGYEGFLGARRLGGGPWDLNPEETMLSGAGTGTVVRLGDRVRVQVERVDAARGRVDLLPVEL